MNNLTNDLYVGSSKNRIKNVPTMKQTEEKPTNYTNNITMSFPENQNFSSVCFFCRRECKNYSYLVESIYEFDWTTFIHTDVVKEVRPKGVICHRCRDYNEKAHLIILNKGLEILNREEVEIV